MFNIQKKIQCIKWFYAGNSQVEVRDLFSAVYHDRPIPTITTINRIIKQFISTGSVFKPCKKCSLTVEKNNKVQQKNLHIYCNNKINNLLYQLSKIYFNSSYNRILFNI